MSVAGTSYHIGRNQACLAQTEPSFNATPSDTNGSGADEYWENTPGQTASVKIQNYKFEPQYERKDRLDTRATRDVLEQIEGVIETNWNVDTWLLPRGGTTAPDAEAFFLSAMGVAGSSGGDYDFTLSGSQNLPPSFSMLTGSASLPPVSEMILGAICNEMRLSGTNGEEPKASFSGVAARHIITGQGVANGTVDGTGTPVDSITLNPVARSRNYQVGSLISIGNSTGHYVTAVDYTTGVVDFSPDVTTNEGAAPVVRPYIPYVEADTGGSPISHIRGSISSSSTGVTAPFGIESFELVLQNNFSTVRPMFNQTFIDAIPGNRMVSGSIRLWAQADDILFMTRAQDFNTTDINPIQLTIVLGAVGLPGRLSIEMPAVKFHPTGLDVPDAEEAKFTLNFTALGTGAGDNSLVLSWD